MNIIKTIIHYLGPFSPMGPILSGVITSLIFWGIVGLVLYFSFFI
jgi:hypothetical protein